MPEIRGILQQTYLGPRGGLWRPRDLIVMLVPMLRSLPAERTEAEQDCRRDKDRQRNSPEGNGHRHNIERSRDSPYIQVMRKKRVLWEVRVIKASDEKTARKAALKELTVRPVDQSRLLIRRTA
jgi:hypothetical protein